jgi:uncharacterized membrane protein
VRNVGPRREALRTTLWVVPTIETAAATALFFVVHAVDRAAYRGDLDLPAWVNNGSSDAARQILTAIAAMVITVVGLVFSITIVALTLASTQFGPRILRNFIRDRGTQVTLGTFVATFVYAILALGSISNGTPDFVPHLSITVVLGLVLIDIGVLVYFIHHVATSIQLTEVVAGIARDLSRGIDNEVHNGASEADVELGVGDRELLRCLSEEAADLPARESGYLQFVGYPTLVDIASRSDAVIELLYRPGHFLIEGLPLARVWPADALPAIAASLERAHVTGAHRTLTQDLAFAIDQLVEIAIRALSPALNDTFTAMTCVDWLGDALSKISGTWNSRRLHFDAGGRLRVVSAHINYTRLVERAFDKIRQAGRGMPAIMIRQLDALIRVMRHTTDPTQRDALTRQAEMILRSSEESVPEPDDLADVRRIHAVFKEVALGHG